MDFFWVTARVTHLIAVAGMLERGLHVVAAIVMGQSRDYYHWPNRAPSSGTVLEKSMLPPQLQWVPGPVGHTVHVASLAMCCHSQEMVCAFADAVLATCAAAQLQMCTRRQLLRQLYTGAERYETVSGLRLLIKPSLTCCMMAESA